MNRLIRMSALATLLLATLPAANAALQTYNFSTNDSLSSYVGDQFFSGTFSFDDSALTNVGDEWLQVNTLNLSFLGTNYTLADAAAGTTEVSFSNGLFQGLSYNLGPIGNGFTFIPDSVQPYVAYETSLGVGTADVIYAAVPEPESYAMLLAGLGLLGLLARRKTVRA